MSKRPDTLKTINLQPSIEEDGESASLSDLDLSLLPNTVELRGGRNLGVEIPSMVTSGGTGILMVKLGTVLGGGTSSSTVTGAISVARVDSVTSDRKAKLKLGFSSLE